MAMDALAQKAFVNVRSALSLFRGDVLVLAPFMEWIGSRDMLHTLKRHLLDQQRQQVAAAMPAGAGARAAKARGWPGRGEGGTRRRNSDSVDPGAPTRRGGRPAFSEIAADSPQSIGGYELIFPFNAATTRLAGNVGGNEAQIVGEIRSELQRATQQFRGRDAAAADADEDGESSGQQAAEPGREPSRDRRRDNTEKLPRSLSRVAGGAASRVARESTIGRARTSRLRGPPQGS